MMRSNHRFQRIRQPPSRTIDPHEYAKEEGAVPVHREALGARCSLAVASSSMRPKLTAPKTKESTKSRRPQDQTTVINCITAEFVTIVLSSSVIRYAT